jgi:pimeloyl-ACP methyl ester carboxylesterase
MNGDLRVAYRTSHAGERDIVFVSPPFTNCEVFPELPYIQGWFEAMTSLGRLVFFDAGTGVSDPAPQTLELRADSITAVLDDLGSGEAVLVAIDGTFPESALFAATYPSRTTALIVLEGYADPLAERTEGSTPEQLSASAAAMWGTGELAHLANPACRGTRKFGQHGHGTNAWRQAQGPLLARGMWWMKWTCGRCFPQSASRHSFSITPTTPLSRPCWASTSPIA